MYIIKQAYLATTGQIKHAHSVGRSTPAWFGSLCPMGNHTQPALIIFQPGVLDSDTPLERLMVEAQQASTLDLLAEAALVGAFERAIVATEDAAFGSAASQVTGISTLVAPPP